VSLLLALALVPGTGRSKSHLLDPVLLPPEELGFSPTVVPSVLALECVENFMVIFLAFSFGLFYFE
jgi:hypothetical protein